jgi:hypothetical protein
MCMLTRRLQILLDDERYSHLAAEARRRKVSVAAVIREAIDDRYPPRQAERARAARAILAAEPMPVPDPEDLRKELDEIRTGGM